MELAAHVVDLNVVAEVAEGGTSTELLSRYLRIPESPGAMDAGVAFYTRPVKSESETWIILVLDRVFKEDNHILVKTTVGCAASEVQIGNIRHAAEDQVDHVLGGLGLRWETER
jgi:hypothetical protein